MVMASCIEALPTNSGPRKPRQIDPSEHTLEVHLNDLIPPLKLAPLTVLDMDQGRQPRCPSIHHILNPALSMKLDSNRTDVQVLADWWIDRIVSLVDIVSRRWKGKVGRKWKLCERTLPGES